MTDRKVVSLYSADTTRVAPSPQKLREAYESLREEFPRKQTPGFSARLMLLIRRARIFADPTDAPALKIAQLDDRWTQEDVSGWLERDEVPDMRSLFTFVKVCVGLMDYQDQNAAEHETAYLLFGDLVASPKYGDDSERLKRLRSLALNLIEEIVQEEGIPPDSFDASEAIDSACSLLVNLNFQGEDGEVQSGHKAMLKLRLFEI
ncbi:hypothetical protein A3709_20030 [Halioglobus sp. HI00S01]|uniref:hypothetical protein n=1 Tax=Halioglobus sp. HI00S01 TaxID=1822214 RepID=UPI0007C26DBC|nr:hypothetical protein [Halioglobus sp. HI00S01]KZX57915.1 hypothetical protein A3709_20030 [Halioglobus sp. HI00S01]